jgi:arginine decarboxylase
MVPKKVFFTNGVGRHKERLASFELALRDAGIEKFNLVCVSSIFPPNCKIITKEKGLLELSSGEIVHCVLARNETSENNRLIVASIGCAVPADSLNQHGYLSEHHGFGETDEQAGEYAEDLAASMLATTLGIEFDQEKSWDEREQIYKLSGKIVRTRNITQSAEGKTGLWTSVVAAAVFVEDGDVLNAQKVQPPAQTSLQTPQAQKDTQTVPALMSQTSSQDSFLPIKQPQK